MSPLVLRLLLPTVLGGTLLAGALALYQHELSQARELWRLSMLRQTETISDRFHDTFRSVYEGLRTIARLPGIRALDKDAPQLDENTNLVAQELFNNLAAAFTISEVYIIPDRPELAAASADGKWLARPVADFDTRTASRHRDQELNGENDAVTEEIESHEHALAAAQIDRFRSEYPTEDSVEGLAYPALTGPEVLTCDNRFISPKESDESNSDRKGILYSVPYYDSAGRLAGCVTAILLTRVLRDAMGDGNHALGNLKHGILTGDLSGSWQRHRHLAALAQPVETSIYSTVTELQLHDLDDGWYLWTCQPDENFSSSGYARQAEITLIGAIIGIVSLLLALSIAAHQVLIRRRLDVQRQCDLEAARDAAVALSRAKTSFIAVASHEIRTPMNGVLGMTELLLQSDLPPEQRTLAETAHQSAKTLVDLIQGILDFSRIDAGKLEFEHVEFDLLEVFEDVAQLMAPTAAQKGLQIVLELDEQMPTRAIGDPARLRQVVTNLVGNAVKFTAKGRVSIHVEPVGPQRPEIRVRIVDTGIGLDPALKSKLFQPFAQADSSTTRRFGGSGLGLAISKELVTGMGGSIDFESIPGEGTVFTFTVTLEMPEHELRRDPASDGSERDLTLRGLRVLIVDDDPVAQRALATNVRALGGQAVTATDEVTVEAARNATQRAFAFALVSQRLGAGTCVAIAQALREGSRVVPAVLLESWTSPLSAMDRQAAGFSHYLPTPPRRSQIAGIPDALRPDTQGRKEALPLVDMAPQRILVVDDNEVNRRVARLFLEKLGFSCDEATDGRAAVAAANSGDFDLVLMDWQMPGMDGLEATRRIRAHEDGDARGHVPIVALTASAFPDDRAACLSAGMDDVLTKPLSQVQLRTTLQRLLREAGQTA